MSTITQDIISLADLTVDPTVQRLEGVDKRRANDMAKSFNENLLGTFTISRRGDGSMIVLDGMHRAEAARVAGFDGEVFANVYEGLTIEQEREIFVGLNESKQVSAVTKFVMRVGYNEPVAVALNTILTAQGWRVGAGSGDAVFNAVVALEAVFYTGANILPRGEHLSLTNKTITTITNTWGHDSAGASGLVVKGVAKVLAAYPEEINPRDLSDALARTTPLQLTTRARFAADMQKVPVDQAMAFIIVDAYNKRKRANKVEPWTWRKN